MKMSFFRESIKALSLLLRGHAGKFNNPSTDKAECAHLRECVIELISAYPPMAIKVRHPFSTICHHFHYTLTVTIFSLQFDCHPLSTTP
jgi:hypothetical protein